MGAVRALAAALMLAALAGFLSEAQADEYRRHTNNWAVIVSDPQSSNKLGKRVVG